MFSVFGGVGERTREGNDLYTEMVDSKVIVPESLPDSKVSLIYGQMNEPPGARMRVGLSALTVAEFFREEFIVFRFDRWVDAEHRGMDNLLLALEASGFGVLGVEHYLQPAIHGPIRVAAAGT